MVHIMVVTLGSHCCTKTKKSKDSSYWAFAQTNTAKNILIKKSTVNNNITNMNTCDERDEVKSSSYSHCNNNSTGTSQLFYCFVQLMSVCTLSASLRIHHFFFPSCKRNSYYELKLVE